MGLIASQNSSIINCKTVYQLQFMSNRREELKNTCSCHYQASVSSETDSSGKTTLITLWFCLLATVHKPQLHQNTCTCIKFENFGGLTRQSTPLILPQRKRLPQITHWKGNEITKVVALKFTGSLGFLGIWSAKADPVTTSPQWTQPITRQSYPPCCISLVGYLIWDQLMNKKQHPRLR